MRPVNKVKNFKFRNNPIGAGRKLLPVGFFVN